MLRLGVALRTPTLQNDRHLLPQPNRSPAVFGGIRVPTEMTQKTSTITFCGGVEQVTGSNFLLNTGESNILIDCGLSQGGSDAENKNWEPFPYQPKDIAFLVVTHAHIDHIGRIPQLVKEGFNGRIISTLPTKDLAGPMLMDAFEILTGTARYRKREPLYDKEDIRRAFSLWETLEYDTPLLLSGGVTLSFRNSGHILGSAMACFEREGKRVAFTGDLGGGNSPLLPTADIISDANYLIIESVYGDRLRSDGDRREQLENIIEDTVTRGGTLFIPVFSTERTQDLLFEIRTLMMEKRVPSIPVYLDSPLAEEITSAYTKHAAQYFIKAIADRVKAGENVFSFPELHFIQSPEESQKIMHSSGSKIILAGSGMSSGGRALGHEQFLLPQKESTLLIVGYQSAGSLGRRLIEGTKSVQIRGETVNVHCRVEEIYGYSAHMDSEQLLEFVNKTNQTLTEAFVVMGEPASSTFLAQRVRDYLGVRATTPAVGDKVQIEF